MLQKLKCEKSGYEMDIPQHCGKIMHKEGEKLVCWMETHCGEQPIPEHCGQEMNFI